MKAVLSLTGKKVKFLDISIGKPFFAHGRFWTRTDTEVGTELLCHSSCSFTIDACDKYVDEVAVKLEL